MSHPPHAESTRSLVAASDQGALGTSNRETERPYTSLVEYAPMPNGDPLLLISSLAEHTKNISESPGASLLIAADLGRARPLERERVTLIGQITPCQSAREALADRYLDAHPHAETYIDFEDFTFYRLVPERLRYIGGFGRMSWIDPETYRDAEPDPVRLASTRIRNHVNEDHADALVEIVRHLGDSEWAESATLTAIDRYGFDVDAADGESDRRESVRLSFDEPLESAEATRGAFTELLERARTERPD